LPADDPGFGQPSYNEEMIMRAPHTGPEFQLDNRSVWDMIRHVTYGGPAWDWVSHFARTFDGRSSYLALKAHYLGETFQALIRAQADKKLDKAFYDGTSKKFTFESYISALQHAFTDLEACGDPISESRKVRSFLKGIRDPRLQSCKEVIIGTPSLGVTFEAASTYATRTIAEIISLAESTPRNISASQSTRGNSRGGGNQGRGRGRGGRYGGRSGRGGRGRGGGGGRGNNHSNNTSTPNPPALSDRYYLDDEWQAFTPEQQQAIRAKREERDRRRGIQAVDRNTRPRTEGEETKEDTPNRITEHGIGAVMSRHRTNNTTNGTNS
jgi:hypothetical protein